MSTSTTPRGVSQELFAEAIRNIVDEFVEVIGKDETIKRKIVSLIEKKAKRNKNTQTSYVS